MAAGRQQGCSSHWHTQYPCTASLTAPLSVHKIELGIGFPPPSTEMETFPESEPQLSPSSGSWGTQAGSRSSSKSGRAPAQSPAEPSAALPAALLLPSQAHSTLSHSQSTQAPRGPRDSQQIQGNATKGTVFFKLLIMNSPLDKEVC